MWIWGCGMVHPWWPNLPCWCKKVGWWRRPGNQRILSRHPVWEGPRYQNCILTWVVGITRYLEAHVMGARAEEFWKRKGISQVPSFNGCIEYWRKRHRSAIRPGQNATGVGVKRQVSIQGRLCFSRKDKIQKCELSILSEAGWWCLAWDALGWCFPIFFKLCYT